MDRLFAIGIDLGTTNCALAYKELSGLEQAQVLSVPQLSSAFQLESQKTLPSCCYIASPQETKKNILKLPWSCDTVNNYAVGTFAFQKLSANPSLVVQSAKSWLSFAKIDRYAPILPWGSEELTSSQKISPLTASERYLKHLKDAWNYLFKHAPFEEQFITITVPASFDEVAQHLTLEAARQAGYPEDTKLLEEPQAAFYHYLSLNSTPPENIQTILICDVGGGTSDFSLFKSDKKKNKLERIAVSNHLLLGGDNIDLTIAHFLEKKLNTARLTQQQWIELTFQARLLKERVLNNLNEADDTEYFISLANSGSNLFAASLTTSVNRRELYHILLNGFFPLCTKEDRPHEKISGLKEFGLPYVNDTAITKHLASFLNNESVDAVLFNGGSLKPGILQERLISLISSWQNQRTPLQLNNADMDFSVALGAAHYGNLIYKKESYIHAGAARSLYLELNSNTENPELLCVIEKGFESGSSIDIKQHSFNLLVNQPVRFQLFNALRRTADKIGDIVQYNPNDFQALSPLQTLIKHSVGNKNSNKTVEVKIRSGITETGLLELFCITPGGTLLSKLVFQLKSSDKQNISADNKQDVQFSKKHLHECSDLILRYFGKAAKETGDNKQQSVRTLIKDLERITSQNRTDWSLPFIRSLWPDLSLGLTRRNRSLAHECTWLNLSGFILRPGYGAELDNFRIKELWKAFKLGLAFPKEQNAQVQWALMWRRVAGGLDRQQQQELFAYFRQQISMHANNPELFRMAASLERLDSDQKIQIGDLIVKRLLKTGLAGQEQFCWAFGRLASRIPLYAEINTVISPLKVQGWFEQLTVLDWKQPQYLQLNNAFSLAAAITGDRVRDIEPETRQQIINKMKMSQADPKQLDPLMKLINLQDEAVLFGESLPAGLAKI